jgi:hypothetical protein
MNPWRMQGLGCMHVQMHIHFGPSLGLYRYKHYYVGYYSKVAYEATV